MQFIADSRILFVITVAAAGLYASLCSVSAQEVPKEPKEEPAVRPGFADRDETGSLPAFTTELSKKAANAISKRDWKTARECYLEMLEAEPGNPLTLSNLGAVEYQMGNVDGARAHLEQAVSKRPKLAATWITLALIYYQKEQSHLALSAISRAVHERPRDPRARNYFAVIVKSLGWANAAEGELQRAIEIDPNYAEAHFNLSLMYLERKPPATALARRHYEKALDLGAEPDALVEEQLQSSDLDVKSESESDDPAPPADSTETSE